MSPRSFMTHPEYLKIVELLENIVSLLKDIEWNIPKNYKL